MATDADKESEDKAEYLAIFKIFQKFLRDYGNMESREDLLEEMMRLRFEFAFNHAVRGFNMDFEEALALIRNTNDGLSQLEQEQRKVLLAALDNLVDFAVAEEYQMAEHLPETWDEEDEESMEDCYDVFEKYNDTYAEIENGDIEYALGIAAGWVRVSFDTVLVYMTQGDERVRPWHLALEGTAYRKSEFPSWLIPPIEHGCRCFLVEEGADMLDESRVADVMMATKQDIPDFVSPVFRDSVCTGGKIFGAAHSYFKVKKKDKKKLRAIADKIKKEWLER